MLLVELTFGVGLEYKADPKDNRCYRNEVRGPIIVDSTTNKMGAISISNMKYSMGKIIAEMQSIHPISDIQFPAVLYEGNRPVATVRKI